MPPARPAANTGRRAHQRAGRADAKQEIQEAARTLFASRGFTGTTMRAVARAAGVDVALIPYYFGNKEGLFAATLDFPLDPRAKLDEVFGAGLDGIGERVIRTVHGLIQDEQTGPALIAIIRSAVADESANSAVRDFILNVILEGYARHIPGPDAHRRAALAASQVVGLAIGRYVLCLPPLAEMTLDEVVEYVGPTLQRYLAEEPPRAAPTPPALRAEGTAPPEQEGERHTGAVSRSQRGRRTARR
ncbi:TetR family transcriptional regulator [Intrasporangium sp.]|uniref:TetR/AcrR family transcriptional regulator n=1 Tax=Intrasporangium sp. TaxID=1925024 RepID=UPI00322184F3